MQVHEQLPEISPAFAAGGEDTALRSALQIIKEKQEAAESDWRNSELDNGLVHRRKAEIWYRAAHHLKIAIEQG